jgi:hypothetical protein
LRSDTVASNSHIVKSQTDTVVLKEAYNEDDLIFNEHLTEELKPIRANFKRINLIKEWTSIDKRKLEKAPYNGIAEYYYLKGNIEKIIARYPNVIPNRLTEYYLFNQQLSFVIEKSYVDAIGPDTEQSEIIEDRSYFKDGKLIHQINNQDCGSPFTDEYLLVEQKRLITDFDSIKMRISN